MKRTGIFIESKAGVIKSANYGVIACAQKYSAKYNEEIYAFIIDEHSGQFSKNIVDNEKIKQGFSKNIIDNERIKQELGNRGIKYVIEVCIDPDHHENHKQHENIFNPVVWSDALIQAVIKYKISTLFALSTHIGKELLPRVAAQLDAPLIMDCLNVSKGDDVNRRDDDAGNEFDLAETFLYSGKTIATVKVTGNIRMFGIRPNVIEPCLQAQNYESEDSKAKIFPIVETFIAKTEQQKNIKLIETKTEDSSSGEHLLSADVIISGGRAMKNGENFKLLQDCADSIADLGAATAVGASRVAVDLGWVPYSMQVGQTGEKVSPKVYIACGISGSIQHFAGMKTSKMIIAINESPNAAIMSNCDYFVEADLFKILPELIKELKNTKRLRSYQ
ncbi:MAG: hypothetical protein HQK70_01515 [Desulfamplus sp.]|nr:hypothetical protein [Desulfamplus sp.]